MLRPGKMQASLLLPSLIHILTLCRPPYHEAPETPPRRARAGHPVATEKRVKTRRTGIPPTTRRNDAAPKLRTARRPQLRIAPASARKRTYPPRNIHSTHSVHSTQHPPCSTSQLRHNRIGSARQRTPHTTGPPPHSATVPDSETHGANASQRSAPPPYPTTQTPPDPYGSGGVRHAATAITCGTPSRSRRWRSRPAPPRCGAAGCTWPYGPNATSNRS